MENNNKLPFLDVLVEKNNNKFETSIFRKKTFSGLGMSYFSCTPFLYKINAIKTLLDRAKKLSSNFTNLNKELSFLGNFFRNNGYPNKFIFQ